MKAFNSRGWLSSWMTKSALTGKACITLLLFTTIAPIPASAQAVLFDFDSAAVGSTLPIVQTSGGVTAHLSATGPGYSIQAANVLGFTPAGFSGRILYPDGIGLADLLIRFDQTLTDFSIMYCCQELGCDDAATMRVTAFMNGSSVGTNTKTASYPGTWPVDTLACSFPQGFDSVVVHYASPPPTCQDYGTIFMADNMRVTLYNPTGISYQQTELPSEFFLDDACPTPFNPATTIRYQLPEESRVTLQVYNVLGQIVATLVEATETAGFKSVSWDAGECPSGVYFYRLQARPSSAASAPGGDGFVAVKKTILAR